MTTPITNLKRAVIAIVAQRLYALHHGDRDRLKKDFEDLARWNDITVQDVVDIWMRAGARRTA